MKDIDAFLEKQIEAAFDELGDALANPSKPNPWLVKLPDPSSVDLSLQELGALVVETSNNYGNIARLSGIAKARAKITRGKFERKYKSAPRLGSNEKAREAAAWASAITEHEEAVAAEALAAMAESLEDAARVASESARKIYDKTLASYTGFHRADTMPQQYKNQEYTSVDNDILRY